MQFVRALFGLAICGCDAAATSANTSTDTSVTDARDTGGRRDDPNCHWDCLGAAFCEAGVVTAYVNAPVPCWAWTGSCPVRQTIVCSSGCRSDGVGSVDRGTEPRVLCEEWRPKKLGDRCLSNSDCTPTSTLGASDAGSGPRYLKCGDGGLCVEGEPPVFPDYLGDCGLVLPKLGVDEGRMLDAPSCSGKLCVAIGTPSCVAAGCTVECRGEDGCPRSSTCMLVGEDGTEPRGICVPVPSDGGRGLNCVPAGDAGADG